MNGIGSISTNIRDCSKETCLAFPATTIKDTTMNASIHSPVQGRMLYCENCKHMFSVRWFILGDAIIRNGKPFCTAVCSENHSPPIRIKRLPKHPALRI